MHALTAVLIHLRIVILTSQGDTESSLCLTQPLVHYYEEEGSTPDIASTSLRRKLLVSGQTIPITVLFHALSDERKSFSIRPANLTAKIERLVGLASWQRKLITGSITR